MTDHQLLDNTKNTKRYYTDFVKRFQRDSDQSKNAKNQIEATLEILRLLPPGDAERNILLNRIRELRNLPTVKSVELQEIKKKIPSLEKQKQDLNNFIDELKKLSNTFEAFLRNLRKLKLILAENKFNEGRDFYWYKKADKTNNVNIILFMIQKLDAFYNENNILFSTKQEDNDSFMSILTSINTFIKEKKDFDFNKINETFQQSFSKLNIEYDELVKLLSYIYNKAKEIIEYRNNASANKNKLKDTDLARNLNQYLELSQKQINEILLKERPMYHEIELTVKSVKIIIETINKDIDFLNEIISPEYIRKLRFWNKRDEPRIDDPYYIEAKSNKNFYYPERNAYKLDPTGIYNWQESKKILFEQEPKFENNNNYDMSTNINKLIEEYFFRAYNPFFKNYKKYVNEIYDIVKRSPKLDPNIKAALIIPAYMEGKSIEKTLKKYSSCYDFGKVAIFVLENYPIGKERDLTLAKIQLFKLNNPNVKVYHILKKFEKRANIGLIRKYIADYVLLLKYYSKHSGNLILVGGDGDCEDINHDFFRSIINRFETNPNLDAVEMKMDFPKDYRMAFPNLWVMHRAFDFAWKYMRRRINPNKAVRMYGPASAIKASSYLMIKGFNPRTNLCEDLQLSWLLDEARRKNINDNSFLEKKFFEFLPYEIITNPRRAIMAQMNKISLMDMYENFNLGHDSRDWQQLVKDNGEGLLNVGNTYSTEEIRKAINKFHETPINKREGEDIYTSLAFGLQRYIDWWHRKVDPIEYKRTHKHVQDLQEIPDHKIPRWMNNFEFEIMLEKVMKDWLGIEYEFKQTLPDWTIRILNVDKLEKMMLSKMKEINPANTRKLNIINYKPLTKMLQNKEITLILIGHTTGDVGEVSDAKKMLEIFRENKLPIKLYDIYDFIERKYNKDDINKLADENYEALKDDKIILDPNLSPITTYSYQKIKNIKEENPNGVIMFVTWQWNVLFAIRMGFKQLFPTIGMNYQHNLEKTKGLYANLYNSLNIISCLTPIAMVSTLYNNIPKNKIILGQHKYSYNSDRIYSETKNNRDELKKEYISSVLKKMNKTVNLPENIFLIGSISRFIEHYRNSFILEAIRDIAINRNDLFVLFKNEEIPKGGKDRDNEFFEFVNKYKSEHWLLYDNSRSGLDEIIKIYSYLDLAIFAGAIGNASVEIASVGTPLLLINEETNKSIFLKHAYFFEDNAKDLRENVLKIINLDKVSINNLRIRTRNLAQKKFSPDIFKEKLILAMRAAKTDYENNNLKDIEKIKRDVEMQFDADLNLFEFKA
jgi:hypothetical protein